MATKELKPVHLYSSIPSIVAERSKNISLPPLDIDSSPFDQLKGFVQTIVPYGDKHEVSDELQKSFLLGDRKSRIRPHKSLNRPILRKENAQHRGKKRMTAVEKRKCGLLRLNKKNKTFDMFVPIHKMWRDYAEELLGLEHCVSSGWTSSYKDNKTATIQNKLKKIEYYGSILKVTKSRCPSYVGTEGIVIQETKNTFSIIGLDNKVKIIPKLHSEFSLIVKNVGFTILGNHLHQRPVDRAKKNFKQHCFWL